jgi:hypothetical protein
MPASATVELQYVPDWPERAAARLRTPWRAERTAALVAALGAGAQAHEDECFDLIAGTELSVATGHALDQWGDLVGEQRLGLSDNEYRPFIEARMLVNRCTGTVEELLAILRVATGPDSTCYHRSLFPACYVLLAVRSSWLTAAARRRVARLMTAATPAGRGFAVIESLPDGFGFEDDDTGAGGFGVGPYSRLIVSSEA